MSQGDSLNRKKFVVTGASGLIGTSLVDHLRSGGADVVRLVRREAKYSDESRWDPYEGTIDDGALEGADAVIHLSGAGIGDGRWTSNRKQVLYDSRIVTTRTIAEHISQMDNPPEVLVSQSAIGIYGSRGDEMLTEESSWGPDDDFLASLTADWEQAADPARQAGIRIVHPRTGLVLAREADLINRLLPIFKAGLGGPIGDGSQWWSWVTLRDVVGALAFMAESSVDGPVNLVAPEPVTQGEFADALADALGRPSVVPVPKFAMKLALGAEKARGIGLSSTRASSQKLQDAGYEFLDVDVRRALEEMLEDQISRPDPVRG
jgi:uncharacterized protein (TIGR01777 family)